MIADNLLEVRIYFQTQVIYSDELLGGPCLYRISSKEDVEKFAEGLRNVKSKSTWIYGEYLDAKAQYYTILVTREKEIETDYHPGYGIRITPEGLSYPVWFGSSPSFDDFLTEHLDKAEKLYKQRAAIVLLAQCEQHEAAGEWEVKHYKLATLLSEYSDFPVVKKNRNRIVCQLIDRLKDTNQSVSSSAATALSLIFDQDFGTDYAKWKAWYEKNKDK